MGLSPIAGPLTKGPCAPIRFCRNCCPTPSEFPNHFSRIGLPSDPGSGLGTFLLNILRDLDPKSGPRSGRDGSLCLHNGLDPPSGLLTHEIKIKMRCTQGLFNKICIFQFRFKYIMFVGFYIYIYIFLISFLFISILESGFIY